MLVEEMPNSANDSWGTNSYEYEQSANKEVLKLLATCLLMLSTQVILYSIYRFLTDNWFVINCSSITAFNYDHLLKFYFF